MSPYAEISRVILSQHCSNLLNVSWNAHLFTGQIQSLDASMMLNPRGAWNQLYGHNLKAYMSLFL
jgi:hypothetical protein